VCSGIQRQQLKTITRGVKSPLLKQKTIMETNTIQLLIGLIGALSILAFAIIYVNLTTKN